MFARTFGSLIAFATFVVACSEAQAACSANTVASADAGRWTSGQLSLSRAATLAAVAGMRCSVSDLAPGADTQIVATIRSANGFELRQSGVDARIGYVASADRDGAHPIAQSRSVAFTAARLRSLSATDGAKDIPIPISFLSFRGHQLPRGRYADELTIEWRWRTCEDYDAARSVCRAYSSGTGTTAFTLSMDVDARPPVVTMTVKTMSAAGSGGNAPLPTTPSRIITVAVENPDVVAIDPDSIVLNVPIDPQMVICDPAEGRSGAIAIVRGAEDGMRLSYGGLHDTSDDVELSSDGIDWNQQPVASSQVRSIRIRVRGTLQPSKSVSLAIALARATR